MFAAATPSLETPEKLSELLADYRRLEATVAAFQSPAAAPHCKVCVKVCCHSRYCREGRDSAWLRQVWTLEGVSENDYDPQHGWLSPQGCKLPAGRPPVCYAFLCGKILDPMDGMGERNRHFDVACLLTAVHRNVHEGRYLHELSEDELRLPEVLGEIEARLVQAWLRFDRATGERANPGG